MGLSASSYTFCARSNAALQGLPGVLKLVDDILIQASDPDELESRIRSVLSRCRKYGITLSASKADLGSMVIFAGLEISPGMARPHPDRLKAVAEFPTPRDVPKLRSFLGLPVQLANFVPDLA